MTKPLFAYVFRLEALDGSVTRIIVMDQDYYLSKANPEDNQYRELGKF